MRYPPEHKQQARAYIVASSGRCFRRHGLDGIGIDGLAREAGVTSGAFYGHFKSKNSAFMETAVQGLKDLAAAITDLQTAQGDSWASHFIDFYLGERRICELGESCGLQSLTPDVMRAGLVTRTAYEEAFVAVVDSVASGFPNMAQEQARSTAQALLALLSGGVTLARSMSSDEMSDEIAQSLRMAAIALVS